MDTSPMPRRARPMLPDDPTLIYDGECGICQNAVALLQRWDREHVLRFIPFQDEARVAGFGIALPELAAAMHLISPSGGIFPGADAVPELLALFPGKRWLVPVFRIPGVMPIARRIYAWIARRRRCLVRGFPSR